MELSPRTKRKALVELREDESRKQQALKQFREWIDKHPSLRNSRQGWFRIKNQFFVQSFEMQQFFEQKLLKIP
jgi:hypothetical protein